MREDKKSFVLYNVFYIVERVIWIVCGGCSLLTAFFAGGGLLRFDNSTFGTLAIVLWLIGGLLGIGCLVVWLEQVFYLRLQKCVVDAIAYSKKQLIDDRWVRLGSLKVGSYFWGRLPVLIDGEVVLDAITLRLWTGRELIIPLHDDVVLKEEGVVFE